MGVAASECVLATAQGALDSGFKVVSSARLTADPPHLFSYNKSADWFVEHCELYFR